MTLNRLVIPWVLINLVLPQYAYSAETAGEPSPVKTETSSEKKEQPPEASSVKPDEEKKEEDKEKGTEEAAAEAPPTVPAKMQPCDRPKPAGYDEAMKLYAARKWPLAQKAFEKIIQGGAADINTHYNLANCLYYERIYSRAQKEYEWVGNYATKTISLKNSAANTARVLSNYRRGICPGSCLKASDPGWYRHPDGSMWKKFSCPGGYNEFSSAHIGQVIEFKSGNWVHGGACPVCGGTGEVQALKDGMPAPNQ